MHKKRPLDLGDFMTAGAVAKYFGVTRGLIYQWSARGRLNPTTVGRAVLFEKDEVKKFRREARRTAKHRMNALGAPQLVVARSRAM